SDARLAVCLLWAGDLRWRPGFDRPAAAPALGCARVPGGAGRPGPAGRGDLRGDACLVSERRRESCVPGAAGRDRDLPVAVLAADVRAWRAALTRTPATPAAPTVAARCSRCRRSARRAGRFRRVRVPMAR